MRRITIKGSESGARSEGDLLSALVDRPEDEKTGANATLGFTFQHWWAVLKATELYAEDADFAIGVEVKEDVVVLDSSAAPSTIWFYQVKKQEQAGVWSLSDLLKQTARRDGKAPSALAKLYSRRHALPGHPSKLCFVSNVGFKVPLSGSEALQFSAQCDLKEFGDGHASALRSKIARQLELSPEDVDLSHFTLERTHLPIGEQEAFVTGKIVILSDSRRVQFRITRASVAAQMLASEIRQRAGNTDFANTVPKLLKRCVTRAQITQVFVRAEGVDPSAQVLLEAGIRTLEQEGFPWAAREKLDREKVRICANLSDRTNVQFRQLLDTFDECAKDHEDELSAMDKLGSAMIALAEIVGQTNKRIVAGLSDTYLRGIALLVLKNGYKTDEFASSADPQPEVGS